MPTGVTVVKKFTYRGDNTEEWSNQYWWTGTTPANAAEWRALFDAIVAEEKKVYSNVVSVIRGYGYDDPSPTANSVWSVDLRVSPETPVAGTFTPAGDPTPGDTAAWVRWKTSRLSSTGKPIYLRKYYHDVHKAAAQRDTITATQITAYTNLGLEFRDGTFLDGRTLTAAGETDTLVSHGVSPYITTRTLKRRGARPGA